jgi:hypothetical protein
MSGFQCLYVQTFSRKTASAGQSVVFVLNEVERHPSASLHFTAPCPPELVGGITLGELRQAHNKRSAGATTTTSAGKMPKLRQDQHTLYTVVASYPAAVSEVQANPATAVAVQKWRDRTLEWVHQRWPSMAFSALMHWDEGHPHLHILILPEDLIAASARARRGSDFRNDFTMYVRPASGTMSAGTRTRKYKPQRRRTMYGV